MRSSSAQERSRRFEAILDAAAVVFAEVGFESATTEAIAARAETSIGSLYQFFPSKAALFEALAARCLQRSRLVVDGLLASWPRERPWMDLIDDAVDGLWAYHQSDPGVRAIFRNLHLYGTFAEADQALMEEFIERTQAILLHYAPHLPPRRAVLIATLTVNVISALLFTCERADKDRAIELLAEAKLLLRRYLLGALAA